MALKIRCGDEVIVLKGANKGKIGKIKRILFFNRVIIEGVNFNKKHRKSVPALKQPGGIFEEESGISIANVAIFNFDLNKADKIIFKKNKNGEKVRIFKSNGKQI